MGTDAGGLEVRRNVIGTSGLIFRKVVPGGGVLPWQPGDEGVSPGALLVVAACVA